MNIVYQILVVFLLSGNLLFADTLVAPQLQAVSDDNEYTQSPNEKLNLVQEKLAASLESYEKADFEAAREFAVSAYLEGFEPVEANLDAVDINLRHQLEDALKEYRALIEQQAPTTALKHKTEQINLYIGDARQLLANTSLSPLTVFISSMVILLREGLEAILVIAALAAFLIKTDRRDGLPYLYTGITAAFALGAMTWAVSTYFVEISGSGREITEGLAALFAALMLFYAGFWLHNKSSALQWKTFIENSMKKALGRTRLWGLSGLAFVAVYREIFETILFYQALWMQTTVSGQTMIVSGFASSAIILMIAGWLILRYSTRLPLRQFFAASGLLMFALAIVFIGKGIAALQEAGKISSNLVNFPQIDLLGIYPNIEGLSAQLTLGLIALYFLLRDRFGTIKQ